ncbi:MAG: DUF1499 domain-containing protein [Candidatus Bathyarchaeota archaeon]|nr:DUF1499 domain-containing protein [Candidatus Bathyarchaeota archaeon]
MKLYLRKTLFILFIGVIAVLFIIFLSSEKGGKPANPAQLIQKHCPGTPNCISTMYPQDSNHFLPPLPFKESVEKSKEIIINILENYSGAEIIEQEDSFIYSQFTIPIFHFVDDVVFYFDQEAQIIHFRSSSRIGNWDLGVNRRRMKTISQLYLNQD